MNLGAVFHGTAEGRIVAGVVVAAARADRGGTIGVRGDRRIAAQLTGPTPVKPGQLIRQYGWGATCDSGNPCQSDVLKQSELRVVPSGDDRRVGRTTPGSPYFCAEKVVGIPAGETPADR